MQTPSVLYFTNRPVRFRFRVFPTGNRELSTMLRLSSSPFALGILLLTSACGPLPEAQQGPAPPPMPAPAVSQQTGSPPGAPASQAARPKPVRPEYPALDYRDRTFDPRLRSARLYPMGQPIEPPVLQLGSGASLQLLFDDLGQEVRPYRYRIVHCNRDWKPSRLETWEYLEGFDRVDITEYQFNTIGRQRFIHYRTQVPATDLRITRSGNYLLEVYDDNQPEQALITRRFYVVERLVPVQAEVARPAGSGERNTHQLIRFRLDTRNLQVSNPYEQLGANVLQNGRWDNALIDVQPQFVRNTELVYERPDQLFEAGKEWRFFSLRSLRFLSERVATIDEQALPPQVTLHEDDVRVYEHYQFRPDMNGNWFCAVDPGNREEVEAEYARVSFFMPYPAPLMGGDFYLFGALTEYRFDPEFRLEYDLDRGGYRSELLLKQGVYNYQYAFVEQGGTRADLSAAEGNWFEAENRYEILVYFRDFNGNFDRIVGYTNLRSLQ